jgi:S-adenosylmethionine decarboxylase proenzyme
MQYLGTHWIVDVWKCDFSILNNRALIEDTLLKAVSKAGATVLSSRFHTFEPQGVTGIVEIAESHVSVHTWPEHNFMALDIFTCGDRVDMPMVLELIQEGLLFDESQIQKQIIKRGVLKSGN